MLEIHGNLWDFHTQGHFIGITTNGDVNARGQAVMGRGIAKQAAQRFPGFAEEFARVLRASGNHVVRFITHQLITIPVKHHWSEPADIELIKQSCWELINMAYSKEALYLPRPGCGNGGLDWSVVRPAISPILDDLFTIVEWR